MNDITDIKLVEYYYNAIKTAANALGHTKSEFNHRKASKYKAELEARGLEVPDREVCYDKGIFNGPGTF